MIKAPLSGQDLVAHLIDAEKVEGSRDSSGSLPTVPLPGDESAAILLPRQKPIHQSLVDVMKRRRSNRVESHELLDIATLGELLLDIDDHFPPGLDAAPVVICPIAFSVSGLDSGCYRYVPENHELVPIVRAEREFFRRDVLLQSEHADAAVILVLAVPLARWLHLQGDRGYRSVSLQIGWLTDRLYLRAEALGLRYTASGGFAPAVLDPLLGLDGYQLTAFFSFIVGVPGD